MKPECRLSLVLSILLVAGSAVAEVTDELRDAAARVDFGFYTEDPSLIAAARDAIADQRGSPWNSYLQAYAAYRSAVLSIRRNRRAKASLDDCLNAAEESAESAETEVEATILIAACASLAAGDEPVRAVLHLRRFRRAMSHVESLEPSNPRYLLVAMTAPRGADSIRQPTAEAVQLAFQTYTQAFAFPDWGEAEALTTLAAERLEAGDRRGARDLVQNALLVAPGYSVALNLESSINSSTVTR